MQGKLRLDAGGLLQRRQDQNPEGLVPGLQRAEFHGASADPSQGPGDPRGTPKATVRLHGTLEDARVQDQGRTQAETFHGTSTQDSSETRPGSQGQEKLPLKGSSWKIYKNLIRYGHY